MLLRLDDSVPKAKPATEEETNEFLKVVPVQEVLGKECPICLAPFKEDDSVAAVPCVCAHTFHRECISYLALQLPENLPIVLHGARKSLTHLCITVWHDAEHLFFRPPGGKKDYFW